MTPLHRDTPRILGPLPGPKAASWLSRDDAVMSPSYTRVYPLVVKRAKGTMIEDVDGNRFLDLTAGIAVTAVGHSHPKVVRAIRRQAGRLIHMSGTDFYYAPQIRALADGSLGSGSCASGPEPKRVFFTNSGAESTEAALKLALSAAHGPDSRALSPSLGAFHGRTYGAMSLSGSKPMQRRGFAPLVPEIEHARYGDIESVKALLKSTCPPDELAAVFVEPIQGEGGYIVPPPDFLPGLRRLCDEHGVLLVFDEVQTGFGRTGKMFACEHWGVAPDILCLAKGIANGLPLGAIVASTKVMDWPSGSHASTFGGNPVACAASLATIALVESKYRHNAEVRGAQLRSGLEALGAEHPTMVKEVRGLGLMLGMEVHRDGEPDPDLRDAIVDRAFYHGLLLLPCGSSTVRFCPPLCLSERQVGIALEILGRVMAEVEAGEREVATTAAPAG